MLKRMYNGREILIMKVVIVSPTSNFHEWKDCMELLILSFVLRYFQVQNRMDQPLQ